MTRFVKISTAIAGAIMISGFAASAQAQTIYYGNGVSFAEAKRMCAAEQGRLFGTKRNRYGCANEKYRRRPSTKPIPTARDERRRKNFIARTEYNDLNGGGNGGNR